MSHAPGYYKSKQHPVRMYGAGDLAVAYIKRDDRITARSLVWIDKKCHSRLYGDAGRLKPLLKAAGFRNAYDGEGVHRKLFNGARLTRVMQDGAYIIPYIDSGAAWDDGKFLRIDVTEGKGNISCHADGNSNPTGLSEGSDDDEDEDTAFCDYCEDGCHETWQVYTPRGSQYWCESCRNSHAYYCLHCNEWCSHDNNSNEVHTSPSRQILWCNECVENDAVTCERSSELYVGDLCKTVIVDGGSEETWGPHAVSDSAREVDGAFYSTDYLKDHPEIEGATRVPSPTEPAQNQAEIIF